MSRRGIQLAVPFEEKRLTKWKSPYIVQPKYDGERCRAIPIGEGKYMLLSSQENPFFSVPHIVEDLSMLKSNIELDGELYCHGMSFEEIHSRVSRTVNLHPDYKSIKFHIFDIVEELPQILRVHNLVNLISSKQKSLVRAPFYICYTFKDVMETYDKLIKDSYEGIIVRHFEAPYIRKRSVYVMKFKPKKEDIYNVIGYKEEIDKEGNPKDRLGAFICTSDEGTVFSVGSGFTNESRENLWNSRETLKGKKVKVQYQHLTVGKKVPRFPIFCSIINEDA